MRSRTRSLMAVVAAVACSAIVAPDARGQAPAPTTPDRLAYLGLPQPGDTPVVFAPGDVSADAREINAVFSGDGRELYFTCVVDGRASLFVRRLEGDTINTDLTDYCPMVTPDGRFFFFSRRTAQGGDIYWMRASVLDRFRPVRTTTGR